MKDYVLIHKGGVLITPHIPSTYIDRKHYKKYNRIKLVFIHDNLLQMQEYITNLLIKDLTNIVMDYYYDSLEVAIEDLSVMNIFNYFFGSRRRTRTSYKMDKCTAIVDGIRHFLTENGFIQVIYDKQNHCSLYIKYFEENYYIMTFGNMSTFNESRTIRKFKPNNLLSHVNYKCYAKEAYDNFSDDTKLRREKICDIIKQYCGY